MLTMTRHQRLQSKSKKAKLKLKLNKIKIDFLSDDVIEIRIDKFVFSSFLSLALK